MCVAFASSMPDMLMQHRRYTRRTSSYLVLEESGGKFANTSMKMQLKVCGLHENRSLTNPKVQGSNPRYKGYASIRSITIKQYLHAAQKYTKSLISSGITVGRGGLTFNNLFNNEVSVLACQRRVGQKITWCAIYQLKS